MSSGTQLLRGRNTLWIACGVLLALALIPGLPKFAFIADGVRCGADCAEASGATGRGSGSPRMFFVKAEKTKADEMAKGENLASRC